MQFITTQPAHRQEIPKMNESKKHLSRRSFLGKTAAAGAVAAGPYFVSARALGMGGQPAASDRLNIGLIGAGLMGTGNLNNCAKYDDVVVTAVCDVWKSHLDAVVDRFKDTAKPYHDYRQMLEQDDLDGVIIATPPHWHALMAIHACEAKKDFYLQKPMTLYPGEGVALKGAVEKHGVISQIGTQIHAGDNYRRVVEQVRSGNLGKIPVVRTFVSYNQGPEGWGNVPDSQPPEGLDWDLWLGPAPARSYNEILAKSAAYTASFMDYSGGQTPGMAPHIVDLPYWALGLDYPTNVASCGGRYVLRDCGDIPDTQEVLWQYPELTMTWFAQVTNSYGFDFHGDPVIRRRLGIYFHGVNGTLFSDYSNHKIVPEGDRMRDAKTPPQSIPPSPGHEREWLDAIKSRQQPSCHVGYHVKMDVAFTLANLSLKLGRSIAFDPETEQIVDDPEASRLAVPEYRDSWTFPKQYLPVS